MTDQPTAPNQRTFSLNSDQAYEALCPRDDRPWIPNGALPREPRWARRAAPVEILAESEEDARLAMRSWLRHVCGER